MSLKFVVAKGHDLNCGYETLEELLCTYTTFERIFVDKVNMYLTLVFSVQMELH